jgi:CBS domain containing-hemolysin-like protein
MMPLLFAYALLAIGVSFLCSTLEASLLSLPRSHVEAMVENGSHVGTLLRRMKNNIDRPLAAILTLNTVAHTVGAAGVGAQAAHVFGDASVGAASAVMTLMILVFSEIIPKTIGTVHAKKLAGMTAYTTRVMIFLCLPLIFVLEWVNRAIGYQRHKAHITRSEVAATVRLGREGGSLGTREFRTVSNLLALANVSIGDVLTPRTVVFSLPRNATVGEVIAEHQPLRFARIPVYDDSPEHVRGYVTRFDLLTALANEETSRTLGNFTRSMEVLPEQASVADALDQMFTDGHHIALVVDEYGGMEGIVTLEDLLETLLGQEIIDETDPAADMRELARRRAENSD